MNEYARLIEQLSRAEYQSVRNTSVKARLNKVEKKKMTLQIPNGFH